MFSFFFLNLPDTTVYERTGSTHALMNLNKFENCSHFHTKVTILAIID